MLRYTVAVSASLCAILIDAPTTLLPFRTPLDKLPLAGETLNQRLRRQLAEAGFGVLLTRTPEAITARDLPALVVWPDAVLSDAAMMKVAQSLKQGGPDAFIVGFDTFGHEILTTAQASPTVRPLRMRWCHTVADLTRELPTRDFAQPPELALAVGVPAVTYGVCQATLHFLTVYGRAIETWADLLLLGSLLAREFTARRVAPFTRLLGAKLLTRLAHHPHVLRRMNRIGNRCRIHPTAVLEGCVLGNDVEIGAFCHLRGAWLGDGVTVREHSSIKVSLIQAGAFLTRCDVFNSVVGAGALIVTDTLFNCWIGAESFVGGGSGFSDFNASGRSVILQGPDGPVDSGLRMLGSALGEGCFIGAGLLFRPGLAIPHGSTVLSTDLIDSAPTRPDGVYINRGHRLIQVPAAFLTGGEATHA